MLSGVTVLAAARVTNSDHGDDGVHEFNCSSTIIWHHIGIPDEHQLTLRQADRASPEGRDWPEDGQARTDFATIESNLEFIMGQLARVPTRKQLARYSLLVMVGTACLVQTLAFLFR